MLPTSSRAQTLEALRLSGTWETDVGAGLSVLDSEAAALMAGSAALAGRPLTLEAVLARVHPEDRNWLFERIRQIRKTGGSISLAYRILDPAGGIRWVLNRGVFALDASGTMRGCGAYIDTTDTDRKPPDQNPDLLAEAEVQILRARDALDRGGHGTLRLAADLLLWEIGRALAARRLS